MPENVSPPSLNSQNQEDKKPRFNLYTWLFDNPAHFFWVIVLLGLIGGLAALMVPNCIDWQIPSNNSADTKAEEIRQKSISDLRLHILYITGGIIAILTLLQNSWKNQVDRSKVEDDIQKNKNDHDRQVHAERRSRYNQAIEQFGHDNTAVRLGGINTLIGLADEWASDSTIHDSAREKEVQIIIDGLCSYLRSPFNLAHKRQSLEYSQSSTDAEEKSTLISEQKIRRSIFAAISRRLDYKNQQENQSYGPNVANVWEKIELDFSNSQIFYNLNDLTLKNANFNDSQFFGNTLFNDTIFIGETKFERTKFYNQASFENCEFKGSAKFSRAEFQTQDSFGESFPGLKFGIGKFDIFINAFAKMINKEAVLDGKSNTLFWGAIFYGEASFEDTRFVGWADFQGSEFHGDTLFRSFFNKKPEFEETLFNYTRDISLSFSPDKINNLLKTISHSGIDVSIPVESRLFNPNSLIRKNHNSWDEDEKDKKYRDISDPAM